jgi:hypothetical protein
MNENAGTEHLLMSKENQNFQQYTYSLIKDYIEDGILEIGAGLGTYTNYLNKDYHNVMLCETNKIYNKYLKITYRNNVVINKDFSQFKFKFNYVKPKTVILMNVLEHVNNHCLMMTNIRDILEKEGKVILIVPAYDMLYSKIDKAIGHYRRYDKKSIKILADICEYKIEKMFYFNSLGIFGWHLNGYLPGSVTINSTALKLHNKITKIIKGIDKLTNYGFGLSLVAILTKGD